MKYFKIKIGKSIMYIDQRHSVSIVLNDIKNEEMAKTRLYAMCDYIIDTSIRSRIVKDRNGILNGEEDYIDNRIGKENILGPFNLRDGENEVVTTTTQRPKTNNGVPVGISEMYGT